MTDRNRLVIDGLIYFCDGDPAPLVSGGVTAANITVVPMWAGLEEAFDSMVIWLRKLAEPNSPWRLVLAADDIPTAAAQGKTALVMGWQNILPLDLNAARVRAFHALGLRIAQLSYNEASYAGDGCAEARGGGLTRFGYALVTEMNTVGVAIDVSHCCDATALQAAQYSNKPVLLTHANAKAVNDLPRNKADRTLRAIADSGGVVGLSVHAYMNWDPNARRPSLENFVRHAHHVANLVGVEHVGIGTDFSAVRDEEQLRRIFRFGADRYPEVSAPFVKSFGSDLTARYPARTQSPQDFPRIIDALEDGGFSQNDIDKIVGENFLRVFRDIWS